MPDSPTRELIKEERRHLHEAEFRAAGGPEDTGALKATGHSKGQVRRAVTIDHYEQVLDATLQNMPVDRLLPHILARVRTLLDCDAVTVFLLDAAEKELCATASVGLERAVEFGLRIPVGHGLAGTVISSGESQTLYDVGPITVANPLLVEMGIQSLVAVPIIVHDQPIGVLTAGCLSGRRFEPDEVRLLEAVAQRVGFAIDRTRILELVQVERDKAKQASRFKTTLMHMASHDIKTPLTTMKLQLALVKRAGATAESAAKAIAIVDRNITRLGMILDDFLDLARIEANNFTLNVEPIDLHALASEVVQMFTPQADLKGLQLNFTGDVVVLDADERRMTQVLVNLMSNAIRYTNHGSVEIRVGHMHAPAHAVVRSARLTVQDTGQGMSREQIDRLFQPFGQVHEGRQQGSGLGLHLSKVIVDAHGGTIRIQSPGPEQGCTVTIDLPLKPAPPAGADPAPEVD